ncbi:unnamed protein product [Closterium sp. Yama58-4]|nr:unnamed protein product [Closterium sp. Yama58-4]
MSKSLGIPVKLLLEAQGHVVTIELKNGELVQYEVDWYKVVSIFRGEKLRRSTKDFSGTNLVSLDVDTHFLVIIRDIDTHSSQLLALGPCDASRMAATPSRVREQQDPSPRLPSRGYHHLQATFVISPWRRLPMLLLLVLGFIAFCHDASISLAATLVNSVQGEILEQCAVEMGVKGNTWSNATTCGMEVGLRCNKDGTVNTIDLHSSNLTGSICSGIGKLTTLVIINLSFNALTGTIPASIGQLSRLQTLNLGNNTLTGALPATFSALNNLTFLSLSYNELSGVIPPSISSLSRLQYFQVRRNSFRGEVLPALASLTRLISIDIAQNQFSGSIPSEFGNLFSLRNV